MFHFQPARLTRHEKAWLDQQTEQHDFPDDNRDDQPAAEAPQ